MDAYFIKITARKRSQYIRLAIALVLGLSFIIFMTAAVQQFCYNQTVFALLICNFFSVASDKSLRDRNISPTRVTTSPISSSNAARTFYNIVMQFNWKSLYIVYDNSSYVALGVIKNAFVELISNILGVQFMISNVNSMVGIDYDELLAQFRRVSRG